MAEVDLLDVWGARSADAAELEDLLLRQFANDRYALYGSDPRPAARHANGTQFDLTN